MVLRVLSAQWIHRTTRFCTVTIKITPNMSSSLTSNLTNHPKLKLNVTLNPGTVPPARPTHLTQAQTPRWPEAGS